MTTHNYHDHGQVAGDPISDLRDALNGRGIPAVVAHTGGGVMNVAVDISDRYFIIVGIDRDGGEALSTATFIGYDLHDAKAGADPYVGGEGLNCEAGMATDTVVGVIKKLQATDDPAALVQAS